MNQSGKPATYCKICFQSVTKRNGLQCHGACKKWVHYKCLSYTPGKINDIKAGHIKILCPCPDCDSVPKEILVNPPYTCPKATCPANKLPICESNECPKKSSSSASASNESISSLQRAKEKENAKKKKSKCHERCKSAGSAKPIPKTCKQLAADASRSCSSVPTGARRDSTRHEDALIPCSSTESQASYCGGQNTSVTNVLEQMCKTVTKLTEQIQVIMTRLGDTKGANKPTRKCEKH